MAKQAGPVERAIKRAIAARKETRYVTAKESGVNYATLFRFLDSAGAEGCRAFDPAEDLFDSLACALAQRVSRQLVVRGPTA